MDTVFTEPPLFAVDEITKTFRVRQALWDRLRGQPLPVVRALNGVTLEVARGETLGIVGESGCGKSTLARCLVRLYDVDEGRIRFEGGDVALLKGQARRRFNRRVQMIFQDPFGSLNPRMTVGQILSEALRVHRMRPPAEIMPRMIELLDLVRLPRDSLDRRPHAFSGGQRQRIGIARALALEPDCLVADELVSALDVSVQAQVVNLLLELQSRLDLTILFVAHDLRLVRHISHRVAVMYLGQVVEVAPAEALFNNPRHPYTRSLLEAVPSLDPTARRPQAAVLGELPSPLSIPSGCPFHPRCPHAIDRCRQERPRLRQGLGSGEAACHLADSLPPWREAAAA